MTETCDRCGPAVRAVYLVVRSGELYFCQHCADRLWSALNAQGWTLWFVGEQALTARAQRRAVGPFG